MSRARRTSRRRRLREFISRFKNRYRKLVNDQQHQTADVDFIFDRVRFGRLPTEQLAAVGAATPRRVYRQLERVESSFAEMSTLSLQLPVGSWLSVTGVEKQEYSAAVWVETDTDDRAFAIAQQAELVLDGDVMRLAIPKELFNGHLVFRWDILGPLDRPVTISAVDAVIGVYGITEGVRIFTERGHVSVVDVSGSTQIRGSDNTTAIWAGSKGPVTIDTRGSISLKVTDRSFRTTLRASCNEALGLWLPSDSHPGIQIDVERDDALTHMDLSRFHANSVMDA